MKLNSYITRNDAPSPYPCLMEASDFVVLFHAEGEGVVVASHGFVYDIGYYSTSWDMSTFRPFSGNVTIGDPASVTAAQRPLRPGSATPSETDTAWPDLSSIETAEPQFAFGFGAEFNPFEDKTVSPCPCGRPGCVVPNESGDRLTQQELLERLRLDNVAAAIASQVRSAIDPAAGAAVTATAQAPLPDSILAIANAFRALGLNVEVRHVG